MRSGGKCARTWRELLVVGLCFVGLSSTLLAQEEAAGGMKLYLNGVLIAEDPTDWSSAGVVAELVREEEPIEEGVLVVEDDEGTRELMVRTLEKEGWVVREAENDRVGLEQVAKAIPSLVLLDLMMPEIDGFGFMEGLRRMPGWEHVPVIVITAKDITAEDRERLNGEVCRILQKGSVSPESLLAEIRKVATLNQNYSI
jgi:CheY-like chemotaxis protein